MECDPLFIGRQFYRFMPKFFSQSYLPANVNVEFVVEVILR